MKILVIRSNNGKCDSRVTKEIYSLSQKHKVVYLGWERSATGGMTKSSHRVCGKNICDIYIHIKAQIGGGITKNFFPLIRFWISEYRYVCKNSNKFDVIHACDFDTAFPLLFIRKPVKIVYDIFDYYADSRKSPAIIDKMIRIFEGKIIQKSDATIICSEARRQQISPAIPKRLIVIHNSPNNTCKNEDVKVRASSDIYKIVYVGLLDETRCLSKIAKVISERDDVELHIGGLGPLEEHLKEMSSKHKNIIFYGSMEYKKVLELESRCDIMFATYDPSIPNHKYAAPNKFYEALMLKKPLIMIKNTGMDQYVTQFDLGVVIDGNKSSFRENFNKAIDELISRKDEWDSMGERGYELYQKEFSWDEMERRLLDLYKDLEKEKITEDRN